MKTFKVLNNNGDIEVSSFVNPSVKFQDGLYSEIEELCVYEKTFNIYNLISNYEKLQQENEQLKDRWNKLKELFDIQKGSEEYEALQWLEFQTTNYKNDSIILNFYRILYNFILKLQSENKKFKKLKNNWEKSKEYIKEEGFGINTKEYGYLDVISKDVIIEKIQELEQGSNNND